MFKTKEEKIAFRKGMQAQFNKEHPLIRYEVFSRDTSYDAKGNINSSYDTGYSMSFRNKKEAMKRLKEANEAERVRNERVMDSVKRKSVDVYDSSKSITTKWFLKKVKPYREGYKFRNHIK